MGKTVQAEPDPLTRPVSVRVLGEPLPRVMEALATPAVSLRVSEEFTETKCLAIFRNVPLREAMRRLAQTFGGEWKQSKGNQRPEYVFTRKGSVNTWMNEWNKSRAVAEQRSREFQKQAMQQAFGEVETALMDHPDPEGVNNEPPPPNVSSVILGRFLCTLSQRQLDTLFDGMAKQIAVRWDGEPTGGSPILQLPFSELNQPQKQLIKTWIERTRPDEVREQRLAHLPTSQIGIGLNTDGNGIQCHLLDSKTEETPPLTDYATYGGYGSDKIEEVLQTELLRHLSSSVTPPEALLGAAPTAAGVLRPAVSLGTPVLKFRPLKLAKPAVTCREYLSALASTYELNLVADCHTRSNRYEPPIQPVPLKEQLNGAAQAFQVVIRQEGNFLLARNRFWPDRNEEETPWPYPERWIQAKQAGEGLSVDDLLYLSTLSPARIACIRAYRDTTDQPWDFSREVRIARLNRWVWELVREFSPAQRQAAESKGGLAFTEMSPKLQAFTKHSSSWFRNISESGEDLPPANWAEVRFHLVNLQSPSQREKGIFQMAYLKDRDNQQPFWAIFHPEPVRAGLPQKLRFEVNPEL